MKRKNKKKILYKKYLEEKGILEIEEHISNQVDNQIVIEKVPVFTQAIENLQKIFVLLLIVAIIIFVSFLLVSITISILVNAEIIDSDIWDKIFRFIKFK